MCRGSTYSKSIDCMRDKMQEYCKQFSMFDHIQLRLHSTDFSKLPQLFQFSQLYSSASLKIIKVVVESYISSKMLLTSGLQHIVLKNVLQNFSKMKPYKWLILGPNKILPSTRLNTVHHLMGMKTII